MSVTKYRHHIDTINGEDYVLHKDYTELMENLEQEIEKLNKENKILKETLYTIWNKEIDIDYDKLQKAINDIKNMQKEADKQLKNGLHKMIFGGDEE